MSSKKIERALYGPGWVEVIFGAALSFALGGVLAAIFLIVKPVEKVTESKMPKEEERVRGMVYYVEGSKGPVSASATNKRKQFVAGQAVTVSEDELNSMLGAPVLPTAAGSPPPAKGAKAEAPAGPLFAPSAPNFRIFEGKLQVAVPTTLNLAGLSVPVVVMAKGGFESDDGHVSFAADEFFVGSLNAGRLPFLQGVVLGRILAAQPLPEDLVAAWEKVTDATIDGRNLKLTTQ